MEKEYRTGGTVPKSNKQIERSKIDISTIHMLALLTWYRHFNNKWRG